MSERRTDKGRAAPLATKAAEHGPSQRCVKLASVGALILPDPSDKKARSRAFAIRKKIPKGNALPGEAEWLREYDAAKTAPGNNGAKATAARLAPPTAPPSAPAVDPLTPSFAARTSSSKIMHVEERHEAAAATGDPAVIAAAMAAATSREEGRRYDYLLDAAVGSLKFCLEQTMKEKAELQETQIAMMEAIREQYVLRTQAEINSMQAVAAAKKEAEENGGDEVKLLKAMEQLGQLMPMFQQLLSGKAAATPPTGQKP